MPSIQFANLFQHPTPSILNITHKWIYNFLHCGTLENLYRNNANATTIHCFQFYNGSTLSYSERDYRPLELQLILLLVPLKPQFNQVFHLHGISIFQ